MINIWNPNGAPAVLIGVKGPSFGGLFRPKIEDIHRFQVYIQYAAIRILWSRRSDLYRIAGVPRGLDGLEKVEF